MKKINIFWIAAIIILVSNIVCAVEKDVMEKSFSQLSEEQKGVFYDELIAKITEITDSKAFEQKPDVTKGDILDQIINVVEIEDTTKLADTLGNLEKIKGNYGILTETGSIAGKYAKYGASTAAVIIILFFFLRKRTKNWKWLANVKLPHIAGNEKKEIEKIRESLEKKKPLIEENSNLCKQIVEDVEVMKEVKDMLSREGHFKSFKNWEVLFDTKKLDKTEKALMDDELKKKSPSLHSKFIQIQQKGLSNQKLLENKRKLDNANNYIVKLTKSLMKFESRYDKACKALEIMLEEQETEMENFYKKFIVWKREEVIVDVKATEAKIDEYMKMIEADKDEGMKRFAEEAKKSILIYHLKQQMINAISGKIRMRASEGTKKEKTLEFGGEKENLEAQKKIAEKIPAKMSKGDYEELKKDIKYLIFYSSRIKQLYERWELNVINALFDELNIHEKINKLNMERAKEVGGAKRLAKYVSKKVGLFSREKEMDKIIEDIIKYTKTFGETKSGALRDGDDLKRKIPDIIEGELKGKKVNHKNLDYLKEKIDSFIRNDGLKIFLSSTTMKGRGSDARRLADEIATIVTKKIENIKSTIKK